MSRLSGSDRGFSSLQFLIAASLALVFFVALANAVVVQYSRGAMRSALDQGVRAGSISGSVSACELRIGETIGELLGGSIGQGVNYECRLDGSLMVAEGRVVVESWTPMAGDHEVTLTAAAALEHDDG